MPHTLLKRQTIGRLKSRPLCAGPDKVAEMAERVGIEVIGGWLTVTTPQQVLLSDFPTGISACV